jgi:hypothetical protein
MTAKPYHFSVAEARSFHHPVFEGVTKHTFLVQAKLFPAGLPTGANARDPIGLNRRVYKDVIESLRTNEALPGSFDLMNLGITVIADRIELVDKKRFRVFIRDEDGIVNGAHTARIIEQCQGDGDIPEEQYVEVRIITGLEHAPASLKADIAKGQNTGIAVRPESIYDTEGVFSNLREIVKHQAWANRISWRESDAGDHDVRDLTSVLEALNVIAFPNDSNRHPVHAYEKWSIGVTKYAKDFKSHLSDPGGREYAAIEPLLLEGLYLYDRIRYDFRSIFNETVSRAAGRLRIVEEAPESKGKFDFVFAGLPPQKYRLTKGANFPIFAAFRNCVRYDRENHRCYWFGGFESLLDLWNKMAPDLVRETYEATKDIGRTPDVLGKNRSHWANLHRLVRVEVLSARLEAVDSRTSRRAENLGAR